MQNPPPFWMFALGLLVLLAIMASFPRAGAALLGVIVLVLLLNAKRLGVV